MSTSAHILPNIVGAATMTKKNVDKLDREMAHTESKYLDFPKMVRYGNMLLLLVFGHVLNLHRHWLLLN